MKHKEQTGFMRIFEELNYIDVLALFIKVYKSVYIFMRLEKVIN